MDTSAALLSFPEIWGMSLCGRFQSSLSMATISDCCVGNGKFLAGSTRLAYLPAARVQ